MRKIAIAIGLLGASCAPPLTLGARAIQPSQAVDTPAVWVWIESEDRQENGVYRCVDDGGKPVCRRAALERGWTKKAIPTIE